jgi:hypothetical protein
MGVFSSLFTPSIEAPVTKIIRDARARTIMMTPRAAEAPAPDLSLPGGGARP